MYQLYGFNGAASLAPHLLLEEFRAEYEFVRLDNAGGEHKKAEYVRLNPYGRVPTLVHRNQAVFESAAICLYLCDMHPEFGFLPAIGDHKRAQAYQWIMLLTNSIQPAMMSFFYPERFIGDTNALADIKLKAEATAQDYWQSINLHLIQNGPYMLGDKVSVADFYLMMLVRWGRWFKEPAYLKHNHVRALIDALSARPAVQACFAQESIPAPYCLLPAS